MQSNKLDAVISLDGYKKFEFFIDDAYNIFVEKIQNVYTDNSRKPKLYGKDVFIDFRKYPRDNIYPDMFLHLTGFKVDDPSNYKSAYNCTSSPKIISLCKDNCMDKKIKFIGKNDYWRVPCIYRTIRMHWINNIINLANQKDSTIKYLETYNKAQGRTEVKIRFEDTNCDYLLILEKKKSKFSLISAYPLILKGHRKRFEKEYTKYNAK
jgi:hypothetical protein